MTETPQTTRRLFALVAVAALISGCANTSGLEPQVSRAGFDGARVVHIEPHGTACAALPCISVGAQWSSANPGAALLLVRVTGGSYTGIRRVELNVDGVAKYWDLATSQTRFSSVAAQLRESQQSVGVPLSTIGTIATAGRAWVRVHTSEGYLDAAIVDGQADSKALHALRRFLQQQRAAP